MNVRHREISDGIVHNNQVPGGRTGYHLIYKALIILIWDVYLDYLSEKTDGSKFLD